MTNQNQPELDISLCTHCYCMTKTIDGICGKCKKDKNQPVSACCSARMEVIGSITKHYQCTKCEKPCDIKIQPEQAESAYKHQWEKKFDQEFRCECDSTEGHYEFDMDGEQVKSFISTLLQKKEAEYDEKLIKLTFDYKNKEIKKEGKHKKEINRLRKFIDLSTEGNEVLLKELKQQHREQLEGLKMEEKERWKTYTDNQYHREERIRNYVHNQKGYNQAVAEINSNIDTLLQTITTEEK